MPTSFAAMHAETQPRSLVDEPREHRVPRGPRPGVALAVVMLIAFPLLAAVLL